MPAFACPRCANVVEGDPAKLRCPRCGYPEAVAPAPTFQPVRSAPRPLRKLRTWLFILVPLALLVGALFTWQTRGDLAALRDLRTTGSPSKGQADAIFQHLLPLLGYALLAGLASIPLFVVKVIWTYRARGNVDGLHRGFTWSHGWAIGAWFIPFASSVLPYLLLRETERATITPPSTDTKWKQAPASPLLLATMVVEIAAVATSFIGGIIGSASGHPGLTASTPWILAILAAGAVAQGCFLVFVNRLTDLQDSWPSAR